MIYVILFLLIGAGALAYGIREQKEKYGDQHFAEAVVVGHQTVRTTNMAMNAMNAVTGIVNPVVMITMPDGTKQQVKLHTQVPRNSFSMYPELDVGGTVSVTYFGTAPHEAFLTSHPLAQKPLRCSAVLLVGIVFLLLSIAFAVLYFFTE